MIINSLIVDGLPLLNHWI